jgi:hypothetical protein
MSFNKVAGHISIQNPDGIAKVLFRATAINLDQMKLIEEIRAHFNGENVLTRKQLRDAHGVLRGRKAAPYFVSKNLACKVKDKHGFYDISRLKLSAEAIKQLKTVESSATETVTVEKKAKRVRVKKEAKAKREAKAKKEETVEAPPASEVQLEQSVALESFDL